MSVSCIFFPLCLGLRASVGGSGIGGDSTCLRGNLKREFILRHKRAETRWPQGETNEQTGAWKEREGQRCRCSLSKPISAASYRKQSVSLLRLSAVVIVFGFRGEVPPVFPLCFICFIPTAALVFRREFLRRDACDTPDGAFSRFSRFLGLVGAFWFPLYQLERALNSKL